MVLRKHIQDKQETYAYWYGLEHGLNCVPVDLTILRPNVPLLENSTKADEPSGRNRESPEIWIYQDESRRGKL